MSVYAVVFILGVCVGTVGSTAIAPDANKLNQNKAADTNCVIDEIVQLANASTIMAPELLAPQSIINMLQPHVRSRTTTHKTDGVIFVSGVLTTTNPVKTSAKALVDETIPLNTVTKIREILNKERQCKLNGKTYDVYAGDLPLTKAKRFRELFALTK